MLDQKLFGEKLRHHRKRMEMTQEEVAERVGVSPQAVSKWEAGDCLPDCFNLKTISKVYKISADVLLETETDGDIDTVASKIEQLGTEFIWANADCDRYHNNLHRELGEDLWKMWKGLYFAETGNRKIQEESKVRGNLRISGPFGMKLWDDDGIVCIIKSALIQGMTATPTPASHVIETLCAEAGQRLIAALDCSKPVPKEKLLSITGIDPAKLNELLLLFLEWDIVEYISDREIASNNGYKISGKCGIAAYMVLGALHVFSKRTYEVSEYFWNPSGE